MQIRSRRVIWSPITLLGFAFAQIPPFGRAQASTIDLTNKFSLQGAFLTLTLTLGSLASPVTTAGGPLPHASGNWPIGYSNLDAALSAVIASLPLTDVLSWDVLGGRTGASQMATAYTQLNGVDFVIRDGLTNILDAAAID